MRNHNWKSVATLALVLVAYFAASERARAQADAKATAVLAEVRKALGGEQKIGALKGFSLRADYRREMSAPAGGGGGGTFVMIGGPGPGGTQSTGKIEIDLALPDRYLRADIGSAAFGLTRTEGFEASRPFLEIVPNTPGMNIRVDSPAGDPARAQAALRRSQVDLARLFLGLTGGTQPGFTATYAYGGQAESPDGKADILDVSGPDGFKARLFVDAETHLPLMLSYMEAEPRTIMRTMTREGGRGGGPVVVAGGTGQSAAAGSAPGNVATPPPAGGAAPGPAGAPATGAAGAGNHAGSGPMAGLTQAQRDEIEKQMKEAEATPPKLVEYRLFFSDYREVNGVLLPHRIARGVGAKTTEEWDVTAYKINPTFKADRFKVGS